MSVLSTIKIYRTLQQCLRILDENPHLMCLTVLSLLLSSWCSLNESKKRGSTTCSYCIVFAPQFLVLIEQEEGLYNLFLLYCLCSSVPGAHWTRARGGALQLVLIVLSLLLSSWCSLSKSKRRGSTTCSYCIVFAPQFLVLIEQEQEEGLYNLFLLYCLCSSVPGAHWARGRALQLVLIVLSLLLSSWCSLNESKRRGSTTCSYCIVFAPQFLVLIEREQEEGLYNLFLLYCLCSSVPGAHWARGGALQLVLIVLSLLLSSWCSLNESKRRGSTTCSYCIVFAPQFLVLIEREQEEGLYNLFLLYCLCSSVPGAHWARGRALQLVLIVLSLLLSSWCSLNESKRRGSTTCSYCIVFAPQFLVLIEREQEEGLYNLFLLYCLCSSVPGAHWARGRALQLVLIVLSLLLSSWCSLNESKRRGSTTCSYCICHDFCWN